MSPRFLALCVALTFSVPVSAADEREVFFEKRVRPLLARHCVECHGQAKQESGLRLDTRVAATAELDFGVAVVPGKPDESRLIDVIRYDELDVQMPPKGALPATAVADLEKWIRDGAFWPETAKLEARSPTHPAEIDRFRSEHWAFRPVERPPVPRVASPVANPVDAFVRRRLNERKLEPSPIADRRTLLRRWSFDLRGLPPSYEEVREYVDDPSPDADARVVDRLLASPHFGERWGRYWLDIARYADTKGYVFTAEKRYPYAYTYRDYVVRAFNADVPFDRFVQEQLAADQLEPGDRPEAIAALGFLTVGRRFRNSQHDIIDDRIDVVSRGLLGLTAACARCHDHKYDPVPTADYYSLYGVFASSFEPPDLPLVGEPEKTPEYEAYLAELDKRRAAKEAYDRQAYETVLSRLRSGVGDYLVQIVKKTGQVPEEFYVALKPGDTRPRVVTRWERFLKQRAKPNDPVFGAWHALSQLPADGFAEAASAWLTGTESERLNARVRAALTAAEPKSMYDVAGAYGTLFAEIEKTWRAALAAEGPAPTMLEDPVAEQLRQVLYASGSPTALTHEQARNEYDRVFRDELRRKNNAIEKWRLDSPASPPRAMVLRDKPKPVQPVVFLRGTPGNRGPTVPRRFPQLLKPGEAGVFRNGSGRRELAEAIVDPKNPLTARVYANRVWLHLFGRGLVTTPSDFGLRSDPPTHLELLDWLAAEFVEHGWSTKHLVRTIVLSETYRQASLDRPDARGVDPENQSYWRQNRRRLDFEAGRDAVLAVSGRMSTVMYGRPVEVTNPTTPRRTVYGKVDRNNLPALHRTFDFASPDVSTGQRPTTSVPQQALFALNSPFAMQHAEALAATVTEGTADERIARLYERALARQPTNDELQLARGFLDRPESERPAALVRLAHVLLMTNEFAFVD